VIALFAIALLLSWRLRETRFGAHLSAVGGNVAGARVAGTRTDLVIIKSHELCSLGRPQRPPPCEPPTVRNTMDWARWHV
jgi:predicted ABC-type sugar transport system permease subunit